MGGEGADGVSGAAVHTGARHEESAAVTLSPAREEVHAMATRLLGDRRSPSSPQEAADLIMLAVMVSADAEVAPASVKALTKNAIALVLSAQMDARLQREGAPPGATVQ